jgi:hypothetical protein
MLFTRNLSPLQSSIKSLNWISATSTKICTKDRSMHAHANTLKLNTLASKSFRPPTGSNIRNKWPAEYRLFKKNTWAPSIFRASWFGRWVVTHSLADFDFHDHRPAVWINQHLFDYLMSVHSGTLTPRSVHPASPVLLTKNGPLETHIEHGKSIKHNPSRTDSKFENRSRLLQPQAL